MPDYYCPLCKQEVTKNLFEQITGIWKEKEKRLSVLKEKEAELRKREKGLRAQFEKDRIKIVQQEQLKFNKELLIEKKHHQTLLKTERESIKAERIKIKKEFERKLATETNKAFAEERRRNLQIQKSLKARLEETAKRKLDCAYAKIEKEKTVLEKRDRTQRNKYDQLNKQFSSMQEKSKNELDRREKKIQSLEEQIKKNRTPQALGLLEESRFLDELTDKFRDDKFDHPGKGGDVVHHIIENGKTLGIIVYELKKVAHFNSDHITQAFEAKQQREADYAILVTNAKRKKDEFGFSTCKDVIIIHPAGVLVLVAILREHIVTISKLSLSKEQREITIKNVLNYIQSPVFKNGIENIIVDTIELYNHLQKEAKEHINAWETRLSKYRNIHSEAYKIKSKVINLLDENQTKEKAKEIEIGSITLQTKID